MVANLTIGKKGYEEHEELMQHIAGVYFARAKHLSRILTAIPKPTMRVCLLQDAEATDEEKAARSAAIQEATKFAALVPMQVARNAYELMTVIMGCSPLGNRT